VLDLNWEKLLRGMADITVFYKGGFDVPGFSGRWPAPTAKDFFRAAHITK
jgi:hypothetical protein